MVRHDSSSEGGLALPEDIDSWLSNEIGQFSILADTSWPRPNSRVWRIRLPDRDAFVKISPGDDSFRREHHALTATVPRSRIDAPELIAAAPALRTLVMSAVPGRVVRTLTPPLEPTVERDVHHRAGRALAALHRQIPSPIGPGETARRLDHLLGAAVEREAASGSVLDHTHHQTLARAHAAMAQAAPSYAPATLHGDFQPRNWLWSRQAERLALIDFEAVTRGFWVEDLAWLFATTWSSRPDLRDSLLRGYGAGEFASSRREQTRVRPWTFLDAHARGEYATGSASPQRAAMSNSTSSLPPASLGTIGSAPKVRVGRMMRSRQASIMPQFEHVSSCSHTGA